MVIGNQHIFFLILLRNCENNGKDNVAKIQYYYIIILKIRIFLTIQYSTTHQTSSSVSIL